MAAYSDSQLDAYLNHISYPRSQHPQDRLQLLTELEAHHLARVPFENIDLHYSKHRTLSLDPDDLFEKVVQRGRGGYCMEMNGFFSGMLRALGFDVLNCGGRVKAGPRYHGMTHSVNLVTISNTRYLVDVAFGSQGILHPVPLDPSPGGTTFANLSPRQGKLEYRSISQSLSPSSQRLWVYSCRDNSEPSTEWTERYCFTDVEFFPEDYEIGNYFCSTNRKMFFVNNCVAMRGVLNEKGDGISAVLTMWAGEVRKRSEGKGEIEVVERMDGEEDRVNALEKWFMIKLNKGQQQAIRGFPSELKTFNLPS